MKLLILFLAFIIFSFVAAIFIGKILKFGLHSEEPKPFNKDNKNV